MSSAEPSFPYPRNEVEGRSEAEAIAGKAVKGKPSGWPCYVHSAGGRSGIPEAIGVFLLPPQESDSNTCGRGPKRNIKPFLHRSLSSEKLIQR
jgi:hypothetical protein